MAIKYIGNSPSPDTSGVKDNSVTDTKIGTRSITGVSGAKLYTQWLQYLWDAITNIDLSGYVPTSRKINNKALSSDITLNPSDIGALSSTNQYAIQYLENPNFDTLVTPNIYLIKQTGGFNITAYVKYSYLIVEEKTGFLPGVAQKWFVDSDIKWRSYSAGFWEDWTPFIYNINNKTGNIITLTASDVGALPVTNITNSISDLDTYTTIGYYKGTYTENVFDGNEWIPKTIDDYYLIVTKETTHAVYNADNDTYEGVEGQTVKQTLFTHTEIKTRTYNGSIWTAWVTYLSTASKSVAGGVIAIDANSDSMTGFKKRVTLAAAANSIAISGLDFTTYTRYIITTSLITPASVTAEPVYAKVNTDTTASNYSTRYIDTGTSEASNKIISNNIIANRDYNFKFELRLDAQNRLRIMVEYFNLKSVITGTYQGLYTGGVIQYVPAATITDFAIYCPVTQFVAGSKIEVEAF